MREIHRTLTLRLPILAISVTCGCALNFGQVNASGTVNATADTKIENNVDTTINASGSITQTNEQHVDTTQQSPGTPSVSVTEAPKGRLIVYQNFKDLLSWGDLDFGFYKRPIFTITLQAKDVSIPIDGIAFTRIGSGSYPDTSIEDVRLSVSTIGVIQSLPSLKNGVADFKSDNGLFVVPKDTAIEVTMGGSNGVRPDGINSNDQLTANYSVKTLGFSLKKIFDIRTSVPVDIIGTFPLDGPTFKFCCYTGNLTPNE